MLRSEESLRGRDNYTWGYPKAVCSIAQPRTDIREPNGALHSSGNLPVPVRLSRNSMRGTIQLGDGVSGLIARERARHTCSQHRMRKCSRKLL